MTQIHYDICMRLSNKIQLYLLHILYRFHVVDTMNYYCAYRRYLPYNNTVNMVFYVFIIILYSIAWKKKQSSLQA